MRSFLRAAVIACVAACSSMPCAMAQVVINEVLYDPEGTDTGLEFIELINCGRHDVLLTGWVLQTGNGANPDDWTNEWIGGDLDHIEAGGLLVVGEADVVPTPDHVTSLDLQNGPDAVRLTDGTAPVDVVGWGEPLFPEYYEGLPAIDVASGLSLARSPDCFDHDENSVDLVGAPPTPGARNSKTHDLLLAVRHAGRRVFGSGEAVEVECVATNVGAIGTGGEPLEFSLLLESGDEAASAITATNLAPRDSIVVALSWSAPPDGHHVLLARLAYSVDGDLSNNSAATSVTVGGVGGKIALNEVMHSPDDEGTEWVELVGVCDDSVRVDGWSLGDDMEAHALSTDAMWMPPGGYLLVAREPEVLAPQASAEVVGTSSWDALSADDVVVLVDEFGTLLDRVAYRRSWGGDRGVSLERVRADMPPDEPGNWGASVAPEGATPGRTNSIHLEHAASDGALTISPNPFTPDGDGESDRAVVRLELPVARATARVTVFDLEGRMRAILADHVAVSSSSELLWDGTGDDGEPLPSGLYLVCLEAIDARAGIFTTAKTAVGIVR